MTHDQQQRQELARHREQLAASVLALEAAKRDERERRDPDNEVEHYERWES